MEEVRDPYLDWLPKKFSEKYRRYYVNHEIMDRKDLKKFERGLVKAFRFALSRYLRAKGYRLSKEFLEDPEKFGPSPGVLWMLILEPKHVVAIVGDSSIPKPSDTYANLFVEAMKMRLQSLGFDVKHIQLLDFSTRYDWGDAKRVVYVRLEKVAEVEGSAE